MIVLAATASAQKPVLLDEVTVEASRLDTYLPARTEISREELVDSHKSELSSVLELTPGINVRDGGRGEPRLDMRGFDQRATLFTLNGVPVFEPYNGIVNINLFPIDMLGSVETARGPSSALYGPNGMAGTVKMISRRPTEPWMGGVSTIWRNSDFWDSRASAGAVQGPYSVLAGGRFLTSPGFPLSADFNDRPPSRRRFEDGGLRLNSDRDEKSAFADLGYQLSDRARVHATFLGSWAEFGIPPGSAEFAPTFRRNDHQELDHIQAGWDQELTPGAGLALAVFYSAYSTKETQYDGPDYMTKTVTTKADSDEIGGIGRFTVNLGQKDNLVVATQVRQASADIHDPANGNAAPDFTTASTAFENVYYLTPQVWLLAGLSGDLQSGGDSGTLWELNPEGGVAVDFGRFGLSRAGISRKTRFPTLRELYDPVQGNPDLKAESAVTYEIGHQIQAELFYVDTSLFRIEVDNLIDQVGSGNEAVSMNLQDAIQQGMEFAAGARPADFVRVDVNYTYLDAKARNQPSDPYSEIQHKPAHRFNGILRLFLPHELLLRLEGLYTSDQVNQFGNYVRADAFGVFNVQLTKSFGRHLSLFAGVDNVLDTDYEQRLGTPQPGRWEFAGLRATY